MSSKGKRSRKSSVNNRVAYFTFLHRQQLQQNKPNYKDLMKTKLELTKQLLSYSKRDKTIFSLGELYQQSRMNKFKKTLKKQLECMEQMEQEQMAEEEMAEQCKCLLRNMNLHNAHDRESNRVDFAEEAKEDESKSNLQERRKSKKQKLYNLLK